MAVVYSVVVFIFRVRVLGPVRLEEPVELGVGKYWRMMVVFLTLEVFT